MTQLEHSSNQIKLPKGKLAARKKPSHGSADFRFSSATRGGSATFAKGCAQIQQKKRGQVSNIAH
jgi:hypothetical protein